jgi:nucleotide-binding universal stress UspA family protein
MNTILMATDGSPSAAKAADAAVELAQATGWRLHFVTSWVLTPAGHGYAPMTYVPFTGDLQSEHGREVLDAALALAREARVNATSELREGPAVQEICAAAKETGAALIVVGAHGWGPIKRLVFGSVSTGVLHHASCPVLVVPGQRAAERPASELVATAPASGASEEESWQ